MSPDESPTAGPRSFTTRATEAGEVARLFHEAYERLAPEFGYRTREASAKPWAEVPEQNRALMTAVCAELIPVIVGSVVIVIHGYTDHGHPCCAFAWVGNRPNAVARCGGPGMCANCAADTERIHAR